MLSDDPAVASRWAGRGQRGVLIAPGPFDIASPGAPPTPAERGDPVLDALRAPGPGRVALLVGDPGDPSVRRCAEAMDAELFAAGGPGEDRPTTGSPAGAGGS
jgi:hypothetical protein